MRRSSCIIACLGFTAGFVQASDLLWESPRLELDTRHQNVSGVVSDTTEGRIVVRCSGQASTFCGPNAATRSHAEAQAEIIGETVLEIRDWFEDVGLLPSALHLESNERRIWLREGHVSGTDRARVTGSRRVSGMVLQVGSVILGDGYARSDLAHEWFHTASAAGPDRVWRAVREVDPLEEALAEAVGLAFAFPERSLIDAQVPLNLHEPFFENAGSDDEKTRGYEKAPYILFVGRELGAQDNIDHVREVMDRLADDGHNGVGYLYDDAFAPMTFDRAYPEFVALMNQPRGDRYYGEIAPVTWHVGSMEEPQDFTTDLLIPPHAATPLFIEAIEAPDLPQLQRDRLAVARVEAGTPDGDIDTHIHMAFEHELLPGASRSWLMPLETSNEGPFLRLINAGPNPESTRERRVALDATLRRVRFHLPECINPGTTRTVTASGAALDDVDNFRLHATAGTFDGYRYTAPDRTGEVEIFLSVSSPLTHGATISPWPRPPKTIDLGTLQVVEDSCMVRMTAHPIDSTMTYSFSGDYTEYAAPGDRGTYVAVGRMAYHDPHDQGWVDFPPSISQPMVPTSPGPLDMLGPDEFDPEAEMARLPYYMAKAMGWERMQSLRDRDADFPVPAQDCPSGGDGCIGIVVMIDEPMPAGSVRIPITYDENRRPIRVRFPDGSLISFDYGSFDIRRPPGW
ncbi:hypothetical protein [Halomonas sp. 328]|uniref:hypothetical protein n=1 Tax=Halomonas sp. 328 TaxID=2776704 RepID=UPI0018A71E54|nr:hypothetical protein [Halomonas sp. 328]MBF8221095.1 hypothetical protein [Halomonas sp. 328]